MGSPNLRQEAAKFGVLRLGAAFLSLPETFCWPVTTGSERESCTKPQHSTPLLPSQLQPPSRLFKNRLRRFEAESPVQPVRAKQSARFGWFGQHSGNPLRGQGHISIQGK